MTPAPRVPLKNVSSLITKGTTPKTLGLGHAKSGIPLLRAENIRELSIISTDAQLYIDEEVDEALRRSRIKPNDVLISIAGTIGRVGVVPANSPPMNCNQAVAIVRLEQSLFPRYLAHWLTSIDAQTQMARAQVTATISNLSLGQIGELAVPLPPLAEQRRIADILDKADAIRRKRKEAIALTEVLLRAAFLDMFGDPVTNPKGWPLKGLLDVCSAKQWPTIAASELSGSGYPVFGANGIIGYHSELNHAEATVLITCRGATCGTINVCLPNSYVTGNAMALDDPDSRIITREYLEWVLRLRGLKDTITGSAQPQITRQSLLKVAFPVPPVKTQQVFVRLLQENAHFRASLERAGAEADDLFHSLVARAFSGALESSR